MTPTYKRALTLSGLFHLVIVGVIVADFTIHEVFKLSGTPTAMQNKPVDIVQAVAMDTQKVAEEVKKLEAKKQAEKARELAHQRELERQAKAAEQKRIQETKRIQDMKLKADAELKKLREEKLKETKRIQEAKLEQEKLKKEHEKETKRVKELKKLHDEQVKLAKARQEKKLAEEKRKAEEEKKRQAAEAAAKKAKEAALAAAKAEKLQMMQGELNRYKMLILQTLSNNWITPDNVDKQLKVEYEIHIAPGGAILNVTLIKSSGNEQLDRSARAAIYKSSPLPVPKDPDLFNIFRVVHLSVRPEGFVTSG